ncbi:putative HTH-type transcriptional repressor ExuR [compost metagenome]
MEAFAAQGISVPDQVSIIGFDDVELASRINPKLTTVRLPIDEMAKASVEKVISLCDAVEPTFSTVSFPAHLVIRDSCKSLL